MMLLAIFAAVAAKTPIASSSSIEARNLRTPSSRSRSRLLTYACGSKNSGSRRLLERILTHPCSSNPNTSTANDLYNKNSTKNGSTFLIVSAGIVSGLAALLGLLFLVDRETFTNLTGMTCTKHRIDGDEEMEDEDMTPYEKDAYLTSETREYMRDKFEHGVEVQERSKRLPKRLYRTIKAQARSIFSCCFKPKDYAEGDKYQIPWTGSEDIDMDKGGCCSAGNVSVCLVFWEEVRLRLCWRPTKVYKEGKDKYDVGDSKDEEGDIEIKVAASSYESAETGTVPWS